MSETLIHPTAVIEPGAELGAGVRVGPFAVVEAHTRIGDGCVLDAHSVVRAHTTLGPRCRLHPGAVLGDVAQDLAGKGEVSAVEIGAGCTFREGSTVHRGTKAGSTTRLGDGVYLMVQAHVGHNSVVGDRVILVNGAALGGYAVVEDGAFLSAFVGIHQFTRVGALAMVAANIKIDHDVPPGVLVDGQPKAIRRVNRVGLERAGIASADVDALERAYQAIAAAADPLAAGKALAGDGHPLLRRVGEFYTASKRGVMQRFAFDYAARK